MKSFGRLDYFFLLYYSFYDLADFFSPFEQFRANYLLSFRKNCKICAFFRKTFVRGARNHATDFSGAALSSCSAPFCPSAEKKAGRGCGLPAKCPAPADAPSAALEQGRRLFQLERAGIELVILSTLGNQLRMVAALDDMAQLKHHNHVRVLHSRQAVCDHKHGAAVHQAVHTRLHDGLGAGIDAAGRFVQDHNRRISHRRACNGQKLALTL